MVSMAGLSAIELGIRRFPLPKSVHLGKPMAVGRYLTQHGTYGLPIRFSFRIEHPVGFKPPMHIACPCPPSLRAPPVARHKANPPDHETGQPPAAAGSGF